LGTRRDWAVPDGLTDYLSWLELPELEDVPLWPDELLSWCWCELLPDEPLLPWPLMLEPEVPRPDDLSTPK